MGGFMFERNEIVVTMRYQEACRVLESVKRDYDMLSLVKSCPAIGDKATSKNGKMEFAIIDIDCDVLKCQYTNKETNETESVIISKEKYKKLSLNSWSNGATFERI
jgi:hypothetical protein